MNTKQKTALFSMALVLLPVVVLLPRLFSAQFGLLDDPGILATAAAMLKGEWSPAFEASRGRFRPVYWFFQALMYALFGENPTGFFLGNLVVLVILILLLSFTLRRWGGSQLQIAVVIITLLISGPCLETAYTLSKPELLQLLFITIFLGMAGFDWRGITAGKRLSMYLVGAAAAFLACLTKETAVLLLPVSLVFFILVHIFLRLGWIAGEWKFRARALLISSTIGALGYYLLRGSYLSSSLIGVGYSGGFNFSLDAMWQNTKIWLDILSRDYLYLLPLVVLILLSIRKRGVSYLGWTLFGTVWTMSWLGVYIPWRFSQLYYLLPFALGASIVAGAAAATAVDLMRSKSERLRRATWIAITLAVLLFAANSINQVTSAKLQLAVDSANDQLLNFVTREAEVGSLVLLNIQEPNEYVGQFTGALRNLRGRADITVDYVKPDQVSEQAQGKAYFLLPKLENQFYPSYRMGVFEHTSKAWNRNLLSTVVGLDEPIVSIQESLQVYLVDPLRIFCPLAPQFNYCQVPNTPFDTRKASYGWDVYLLGEDRSEG